eukprot:155179-Chlamydomonas_euryale.AAC.2
MRHGPLSLFRPCQSGVGSRHGRLRAWRCAREEHALCEGVLQRRHGVRRRGGAARHRTARAKAQVCGFAHWPHNRAVAGAQLPTAPRCGNTCDTFLKTRPSRSAKRAPQCNP